MSLSDLTRVSTAMIAGLPLLSGGASQTLESILTERVSVKRFGAKGDGSHDDTAAIQAALNWAIAHSQRLYLPAGVYKTTSGLVADLTGNSLDQGNRLCIEGDGPSNSIIAPTSALGAGTALKILGGAGGAGMQAWSEIGGFGIECAGGTAVAIAMENFAFFKMHSIRILGANYGLYMRDVLSGVFEKLNIRFCLRGIYADRNADGGSDAYRSGPNNLNFIGCTVGLCAQFGVSLVDGAVCNWFGGSIEHCGRGGTGDGRHAVSIVNAGLEGGVGATFRGVYFEGNVGTADIWIIQDDNKCAYVIDGCTFNRIHTPIFQYVTESGVQTETNIGIYNPNFQQYIGGNIRIDPTNHPVSVAIIGNGFRSLAAVGGAPYVDDASRPYIAQPDSPYVQITQRGNLFDGAVAAPYWTELPSCFAYMGSNQTIASGGGLHKVLFNSASPNDGAWWDAANSRLFCYRRCRLDIRATLYWTDLPSGSDHSIAIYRNGAIYASVTGAQINRLMDVNPNDVIEIYAYQVSGASRTIGQNPLYTFASVHVV
ncbi:glycosyl hydrolase family 28-related protein [Azospirillum agricola]|uniref:glycosyl hydrolase family 28-related protein n=1 Tax=Azospirillum agricola TaxID=1720247 RepID=UPI000A0F1714|nr:glycosyl hydrolase family 28-related protein [Azospirillum agricola]SMH60430.1 Pectate lyase superfamily protein [Azospirillum lipoferum]